MSRNNAMPLRQGIPIVRGRQQSLADARRRERIARTQRDAAPSRAAIEQCGRRSCRQTADGTAPIRRSHQRTGDEEKLNVGHRLARIGLDETGDAARRSVIKPQRPNAKACIRPIAARSRRMLRTQRTSVGTSINQQCGSVVLNISSTPGSDAMTSIPCARSASGSPMPDSISSCGVLIDPPHTITSRSARAVRAHHDAHSRHRLRAHSRSRRARHAHAPVP